MVIYEKGIHVQLIYAGGYNVINFRLCMRRA